MKKLSLEFLGSGTSVGVPMIGCDCAVCLSTDPLNKRLRSSVVVRGYDAEEKLQTTVVIDTTPDFRTQMLRANVRHIDALIISHYHADHVVGIDDIRRFNMIQNKVIDCWATPATLDALHHSFGYVFSKTDTLRYGLPGLKARPITLAEPFEIGCIKFEALELDHEIIKNAGFRISVNGSKVLSYCLDVKRIPPESYKALEGTHTLVLDMLREKTHLTHMSLHEAMEAVSIIKPAKTWFGHMSHEVDHRIFESRLPENVRLAYDGLVIELD